MLCFWDGLYKIAFSGRGLVVELFVHNFTAYVYRTCCIYDTALPEMQQNKRVQSDGKRVVFRSNIFHKHVPVV